MHRYLGAIDQGTTSTRFMIFDRGGEVIARAQKEHRQITPKPGWVEHDPVEIWENTQVVIETALKQSGVTPGQISAIGITNQRETTMVWDRETGQPVCNAIVWQDTRTAEICSELAHTSGPDRFRDRTGLPLAAYFSGPKIKWVLEQIPGAAKKAATGRLIFGTMDTWLIWNLTGGRSGGKHFTDVTNASRTLLMNLETLDWDPFILREVGIPRGMLPEIRSSSEVYHQASGLLEGVPISGDLGDQQAALFGQGCFHPGEAKNTYGTGCFLLLNTGEEIVQSQNGLLTTVAFKLGEQPTRYALEGSVAIAGALVQWLRDNLGIIATVSEVESLANSVEDNGGVYFVPAFSGLFAPYWKSDARGVIAGLTRFVTRGHIARAALEATAFQSQEILDAMQKDAQSQLPSLKVDGGMVFNELLMQFQADILGIPVIRPSVTETTSLGAAYAAGLAVGYWNDLSDLQTNRKPEKTWVPKMDSKKRNHLIAGWKKAVTRTFGWVE